MDVDVNQPLENPELKELFRQLEGGQSEEERRQLMNRLLEEIALNACFLSVIQLSEEPESQGDGKAVFQRDTTMGFPMLTTQDGRQFYPAFIDWEELGKWEAVRGAPPKTLLLRFDDYAAMVLRDGGADGIVIDPFSHNLMLDRAYLEHLRNQKELRASGHTEHTVQKRTVVQLGDPRDYPTAMVEAVKAHAAQDKRIKRLWLRLMERDGEVSFLIVADFQGDRGDVFNGIGETARPYLSGMYIDLIPYADAFGADAARGKEPFYQRKHGLFFR